MTHSQREKCRYDNPLPELTLSLQSDGTAGEAEFIMLFMLFKKSITEPEFVNV
jgi:hypothetical protein